MNPRLLGTVMAILGLAACPAARAGECKLGRMAELPVTMNDLRPMIAAKINGKDVQFIADSGAFWSSIGPVAAADLKLKTHAAPFNLKVSGVGGEVEASVATVDELMLANIPIRHIEFVVAGSEFGSAAGLLGQNVLRIADVEYDLANGAIRLMRATDCKHAVLAYWVTTQPYSVMDIDWATLSEPHTTGVAYVNGTKVRVMFDTGAATSVLSLRAAERAGVRPGDAGVTETGVSSGVGRRAVRTWIGPFQSFKIGDEEIRNTRLRIGEMQMPSVDMLVGADFFLSHRVYVASSQRKLYFTYNGGPVFNLNAQPAPPPRDDDAATAADAKGAPDEPTDAAGFARRGAAFAARRDYEHAIADLTRACVMAPDESSYFYQRGLARRGDHQLLPALADFDRSLQLSPDDVPALLARADARLAGGDQAGAIADLDAADRAAPNNAMLRTDIGHGYVRVNLLPQAIAQFDLWIAAHPKDGQLSSAFNSRCWTRALLGLELAKALADCDQAVKLSPTTARILDSRGLVRLRLGDLDQAITDYDAALRLQPKSAWSLYGRGLAKLRKNMPAEGQADLAAALALQPGIAADAKRYGIVP